MPDPAKILRLPARKRSFNYVNALLALTTVWCLFSFKIFIVSFGEAGLRPDDLLILLSFAVLFLTGRVHRTRISLPLKVYFLYVGVEMVSAFWNGARGRVPTLTALVFVARVLEYIIFYFIGHSLARTKFRMLRVVRWYTYVVCLVVPLQMLGMLPVPGGFSRLRASANTNGPYEFAVVCAFLLCYYAYRRRNFLVGSASIVMIILTASRITLVASILSVFHFALTRTQSKFRTVAIASAILVIGGAGYFASSSGLVDIKVFSRLGNSKSLSLSDVSQVYDATPVIQNSTDYLEGPFKQTALEAGMFEGDASGFIRFVRWITLVKAACAHFDSILIGLGPSFGSAAVDGYYTRAFAETGVFGLATFVAFVCCLLFTKRASNWYFRDFVMIMAISAAFIDVFLSYKCMMLLWLWHGMNQYVAPKAPRPPIASQDRLDSPDDSARSNAI